MFDYVRCRYPLPHYQDAEFQTKDVARLVDPGDPVDGLLDQYVITKTGRLRRQMHKRGQDRPQISQRGSEIDQELVG